MEQAFLLHVSAVYFFTLQTQGDTEDGHPLSQSLLYVLVETVGLCWSYACA